MPFDNQGFMFSPDGPQPERATVPKYPPAQSADDPQLRGIGFVNPTTGQPGLNLSPDQVQAMLGQLAASTRPPEATAVPAMMGPPAPASAAAAPAALPQILNGADAFQPPKQDLDQRRSALLDRLAQGGLTASGQYYTPKADLYGQLAEIERAKNIGIEQQKVDLTRQKQAYDQSGDRNLERVVQATIAAGGTGDQAGRAGREYSRGIRDAQTEAASEKAGSGGTTKDVAAQPKGAASRIDDYLADAKKLATPQGGTLNQEAYLQNLWQEKGPDWMEANIDAVRKGLDLDKLKGSVTPGWLPRWVLGLRGQAANQTLGESWRSATGQEPSEADKRNIYIRKRLIGMQR